MGLVNAGTADKDIAWFRERLAERTWDARLTPRPDLAILAVQGPNAARVLPKALPAATNAVSSLKPFNATLVRDAAGEDNPWRAAIEELPGCEELVRIPGAGHAANVCHPEAVNGPLLDFLRRHS